MAIDFYWGSGSPACWRVALALALKGLRFESHELHFDRQEHQSPQMLAMNFRGKLPVLRDDGYVVFESLAILYYLDRKYPTPPLFGHDAQQGGVILRVICEYQAYAEPPLKRIVEVLRQGQELVDEQVAEAMHRMAGEARTIEQRLARSDWIVGESCSAADLMIYPDIRLLVHLLGQPHAHELATRFLPVDINYPAIGRWLRRMAELPGHEQACPLQWR